MIDAVSAILLISDGAPRLAAFYRDVLGLKLTDEIHEGIPPHFGCELGPVHFAIHPAEGWVGAHRPDSRSPVIALRTPDAQAVCDALNRAGLRTPPPMDHGFAWVLAFRDPDGNAIEILQMK